jgi:phenylpropionate dioxygenase-like ring-hydroxylating dioxygenase large terminal subunit
VDHATQVDIIARWLELHAHGATQLVDDVMAVDTSVYRSPEWFRLEQDALFRDAPVVACLTADVREPGDHVAVESGGIPLLVVRDANGDLRAFVNACRHRGAPVVRDHGGEGARNFACPFHSWTYALDGRLLGRPRSQGGFDSLDKDACGLQPVPVAEAHGVVFVRPSGSEPIDAAAELAGLGPDLDSFRLDAYRVYGRSRREWQCNWKLLLDTFMESYHVFALHGASVGPDYPGHVMVFDAFGPHLRIPVPRASLLDFATRPRTEWSLLPHATVQYHLSPNAMVNHTVDHLILWRFVPRSVDLTVAEMSMYVLAREPADADDAVWRKAMDDWFELHDAVTRDEDYPESERIQRVLASGRVPSTTLGRNEGAVQHFHRTIRERVLDASSGAGR